MLIQLIHALRPSSQVLRYQVEHFLLTPADLRLLVTCRGDANRYDMALAVEGAGFPRFRPREAGSHSRRGIVDEVASAIKRWVGRSNQSFESETVDTLTQNLAPSTS